MASEAALSTTPKSIDTLRTLEVRILNALRAGGSVVTGGAGAVGAVDPEGAVTAAAGTSYLNSATNSFWFKRTGAGNTGWIELIA